MSDFEDAKDTEWEGFALADFDGITLPNGVIMLRLSTEPHPDTPNVQTPGLTVAMVPSRARRLAERLNRLADVAEARTSSPKGTA